MRYNGIVQKPNRKGLAAIYRQEIMRDVLLFTSQGIASFYDKLFSSIEFVLPRASTGRKGFPKEAMLCASKFDPENQPRNDPDCALGVHTASNQHNEKNYEFYWGYKNHILVDCISGLPIYEITTPANVAALTIALAAVSFKLPHSYRARKALRRAA